MYIADGNGITVPLTTKEMLETGKRSWESEKRFNNAFIEEYNRQKKKTVS